MSRGGMPIDRSLTLTEELEKLEQSITLTLQEIDHNFSKAHRIVTTSILPLVEQYGEHSRSVWEASKFWKQFFEASANVSLSGYEELTNDGDSTSATAEDATVQDDTTTGASGCRPQSRDDDTTVMTGRSATFQAECSTAADDSVLSDADGSLAGSTPRPPATKSITMQSRLADLESPYNLARRELDARLDDGAGGIVGREDETTDSELLLEQHTARLPDMSMTPGSMTPGHSGDYDGTGRPGHGPDRSGKDPLLHRVLDKNYRIMATPHKGQAAAGVSPVRWKITGKKDDAQAKGKEKAPVPIWLQDSPASSPEMEVPKLRSAAFMSPVRGAYKNRLLAAATATSGAPRTPGLSVQTPAAAAKTRDAYQQSPTADRATEEITWDSDSDDDDDIYGGMSPPKTINFALPQSKLLQTPAREASRRIVEDILLTAGAGADESGEYSPTMVKMNANVLDDTF